ncbi:MAG: Glu-tRNA(Gln) amidotransferase subunit GatE [Promethearchaeota archaeon]
MNPSKNEINYEEIGLKCGIEIHQQLKTKRKLFCRCVAELTTRDPDFIVKRNFRPVLGEMGVFDEAMLLEFEKRMTVLYQVYDDINCTYELDDTPPFECDPEAIKIALLIAKTLNMSCIDEFKVCRKNYLDGSVPGGFQRTIIAAKGGHYELSNGKRIGIEILCLEEDSARRVSTSKNQITFRLDRLGIPLVEIATAPDIHDPEEAQDAAARLGLLLRSTGKVRRGLGVTRQDINVSIKGGERIEIKGVQKLEYMPGLVKNEAIRQMKLIELKEELKNRKFTREVLKKISGKGVDLTKDVKPEGKLGFIKKALKKKDKLFGIKANLLSGLLGLEIQPNRRFGTELSDRVKVLVGLSGIMHSDEDLINKYGFTSEEIDKIKRTLDIGENDGFIMILTSRDKANRAFKFIKERIGEAIDGVPPETRRALEDNNTQFLRGLHGGSRLYPDTDSRSIPIEDALVDSIEVPSKPWEVIDDFSEKYKFQKDRVETLILDGYLALFNEIVGSIDIQPRLVLNTLLDTLTSLRRDGFDVDGIPDEKILQVFKVISDGKASKEAIDAILKVISKDASLHVTDAIKKLHISSMSVDDLRQIISRVISDNQALIKEKGDRAFSPLMGSVMKVARGKIDGKIIAGELKKALKNKKE